MDPITHVMGGLVTAHVLSGMIPEPQLTLTAAAASILPDLDFYSRKLPGAAFLRIHHGATHSFCGVLIQALLAAAASYVFFLLPVFHQRSSGFFVVFVISLLSVTSHVLLDLLMQNNGMPLLWPFSKKRFSFPLILAVNPHTVSRKCHEKRFSTCLGCQFRGSLRNPIAMIFLAGGVLGLVILGNRRIIGILTIASALLLSYWIYHLRENARKAVFRFEPSIGLLRGYPARARPDRWLFVASHPDGSATAFLTESHSPAILRKWSFPVPLVSPFVSQACSRIFNDLMESVYHVYPEVTYSDGITRVNFRDLSFLYSEPMELGSVRVDIDAEGRIVRELFQEVW